MSRFLAVLFDGGGNVPPQLGVVKRLVARGHRVRVLADRGLAPAIAHAGAEAATFTRARDVHMSQRDADLVRDWEARTPLEALRRFGEHVIAAQAGDHAADVLAEVARFAPDALAIDCFLLGALVGAEKAGVPTASMMHLPCALPLPGVPPFGLPLRRATGPLGRLRDRVLWAAIHRLHDKTVLPRLNAARTALGRPPVRHAFDMVGQAGAGRRLSPRASVAAITRAVRRLIDEPRYRDGAQRLAASIRAEHTADLAVDELEQLAR